MKTTSIQACQEAKEFLQLVIEWLIALCFMDRLFNSENSRPIRFSKDHGSIMAND